MLLKPRYPGLNRNHPLAKGLRLALPFHEQGGVTLRDFAGGPDGQVAAAVHIGTLTSASQWTVGPRGSRLYFNGSQGITLAPGCQFGTGGLRSSLAFWFKRDGTQNGFSNVGSQGNGAGIWYLGGATNKMNWFNVLTSTFVFADLTDYFFVCTTDGTTVKFYVNGLFDSSAPSGSTFVLTDIGADNGSTGTGETFKGWIDGYSIWNLALTAAEVAQLYQDSFAFYRPKRRYSWLNSAATPVSTCPPTLSLLGVGCGIQAVRAMIRNRVVRRRGVLAELLGVSDE